MKRIILTAIICIGITCALVAAYTKQSARVAVVQYEYLYDNAGALSAVRAEVMLAVRIVNDSDPTDDAEKTRQSIRYNLLDPAISGTSVKASGKTVTLAQLASLNRQAASDRAQAQGIQ